MNNFTIDKIIRLTKDFYKNTAIDKPFSKTRTFSWKGWGRLSKFLSSDSNVKIKKILDLGCGNGRFYNELLTNDVWKNILADDFQYVGLDTDEQMLSEACEKFHNITFEKYDFISDYQSLKEKYGSFDLVVSFGVIHHIPSKDLRLKWFASLADIVNNGGYLCITTWLFLNAKQFKTAVKEIKNGNVSISQDELEEGDYFLGWNKQNNLYRYCHSYSDSELFNINSELRRLGLILKSDYISDGKDNNLNKYFIYKKN